MNIADLDFLTPGSIFVREDGRESRFLFLTNTALPKKVQGQYPPQVVYADENNNVLSCDIDRFLNKRKFHMVDPELEARLNNLLALSSSDNEDALDLDSDELVIDDGEEGDNPGPDADYDGASSVQDDEFIGSENQGAPIVKFIPSADLPAALDADYLAQAVSSYQQSPGAALRSVQHALFIRADAGITRESLIAAFSPAAEQAGTNSIYTFEVDLEGTKVHVNWDEFLGVYPCVFYGSHMYQVIFNTFPKAEQPAVQIEINAAAEVAAEAELAAMETSDEPATVAFTEVDEAPNAPAEILAEVAAQ